MGLGRVELPTSRLSGVRSNHLSYRPLCHRLNACGAESCKLAAPLTGVNRRVLPIHDEAVRFFSRLRHAREVVFKAEKSLPFERLTHSASRTWLDIKKG